VAGKAVRARESGRFGHLEVGADESDGGVEVSGVASFDPAPDEFDVLLRHVASITTGAAVAVKR
jgi:hypothetical protein